MLNVVSLIFVGPQSPQDMRAVDLLEQRCPEAVQAIRQAPNRAEACKQIEALQRRLEDVKKLNETQKLWLSEWLDSVRLTVVPEDERVGLHFS